MTKAILSLLGAAVLVVAVLAKHWRDDRRKRQREAEKLHQAFKRGWRGPP